MSYFGLDPDSVIARIRASSGPVRVASLPQSVASGSLGLGAVSLASFAVWAWCGQWLHANVGELGLYAACAVVLIGGGGAAFSPLVIGPDRPRRFYGLFALALFLYAGVWTGSYFSLRTKSGELLGSLLGPAILGMTFANAFAAPGAVRKVIAVLFLTHGLGYFAGQLFYEKVHGIPGMLLWGVTYGLGFGAGIGYTLHTCQDAVRHRLKEIAAGGVPPP